MLYNGRYMKHSSIGKGSFGKVVKCVDIHTQETVAIKILTEYLGYPDYLLDAREEVAMLEKVRCLDRDNIVQFHNHFLHKGYVCLVFEMLDISLHDLMKERDFEPFCVLEMRPIIQQLVMALKALKDAHIIHADIKPDNVMLVNHKDQPFKVKLIDFGQSMSLSEAEDAQGLQIQSRYYRSPEVLLGLPISPGIDMWSLGCIMAAGVMGQHLYPGNCEYDVMRFIIWAQGMPAQHMLDAGRNTRMFFAQVHNEWRLKTPEEYCSQTGIQPADTRGYRFRSLDDMINVDVYPALAEDEVSDIVVYMHLMKNMLHLDAKQRLWPREALTHPFITMSHLMDHISSSYVKASVQAMSILCIRESMQPGLPCSDLSQEVETSSRGELLRPNLLHLQQSGQENLEQEERIKDNEEEEDDEGVHSWPVELPSPTSLHHQTELEFWEEVCPTSNHSHAGQEVWEEEEDESSKEKGEEEVAAFSLWAQPSNPDQHRQSSRSPQPAGKEDWEEETGGRSGEENGGGHSGQSHPDALLETCRQKKHRFHNVRRAWRGLLSCANALRSRMRKRLRRRTKDGCRRK